MEMIIGALVLALAGGVQTPASVRTPTVLFMCPHGAAKSLMASAYFQKLAKERGLNVRVDSAGTEPDPRLSTGVVAHLQKHGYAIPIDKPRAATAADMSSADVVVSMGCDLSRLPAPRGVVKNWSVPDFSADFDIAEQSIRDQVTRLVDELIAAQRAKP
jgi:arsenate reductase